MPEHISLPYPPSTNNLYRNVPGKGRVKTDRYRTWLRAAGNEILAQRPMKFEGEVSLSLTLRRRDGRRRDLSNAIKATEDLLVAHGIIQDDSLVGELYVTWGGPNHLQGVLVSIAPFDGAAVLAT